jgi:zinc protease
MEDILSFTTEDCREFYRTYYSPNNATTIVVGDFEPGKLLEMVSQAYGTMPKARLPVEDVHPEPPQTEERRLEIEKPTVSEKLTIGYHGPALGDHDHVAVTLLTEVLFGGAASRLHKKLVRDLELCTDVRMFVGPFFDPGLIELFASARDDQTAESILQVVDEEFDRIKREPMRQEEIERARARFELGLLSGLETADAKASTIGFYETVLGDPGQAFSRLALLDRLTTNDLLRVARKYLRNESRSVIITRPSGGELSEEAAE